MTEPDGQMDGSELRHGMLCVRLLFILVVAAFTLITPPSVVRSRAVSNSPTPTTTSVTAYAGAARPSQATDRNGERSTHQAAASVRQPRESPGSVAAVLPVFVAAETEGTTAGKARSQLDRTGSGLKSDVLHRSASWVVDDSGAQQFTIRGGDGVSRELYQLPGEVNGKPGVFEWMVDDSGTDPVITHQRFINGGSVTGYPNQRP